MDGTDDRIQILVLCYQGQCYRFTMYHYPSNRCSRILAYPLDLLLDPLWIDHAKADSVSSPSHGPVSKADL